MAKKDVMLAYSKVLNQYKELLDDTKEYEQAYREGKVDLESYKNAVVMVEKLRENIDI